MDFKGTWAVHPAVFHLVYGVVWNTMNIFMGCFDCDNAERPVELSGDSPIWLEFIQGCESVGDDARCVGIVTAETIDLCQIPFMCDTKKIRVELVFPGF